MNNNFQRSVSEQSALEKGAMAEANWDRRSFEGLSLAEKKRYVDRFADGVSAYSSALITGIDEAAVAYRARHSEAENWYLHNEKIGWWQCEALFPESVISSFSTKNAELALEVEQLRESNAVMRQSLGGIGNTVVATNSSSEEASVCEPYGYVQNETCEMLAKYGTGHIRPKMNESHGYAVPVFLAPAQTTELHAEIEKLRSEIETFWRPQFKTAMKRAEMAETRLAEMESGQGALIEAAILSERESCAFAVECHSGFGDPETIEACAQNVRDRSNPALRSDSIHLTPERYDELSAVEGKLTKFKKVLDDVCVDLFLQLEPKLGPLKAKEYPSLVATKNFREGK